MAKFGSVTGLRSGDGVSEVRADDMRAIAESAEAFDTMTVQSPLQLSRSNGRASLSVEDEFLRRTPQDRTVVITEPPADDSVTLTVRQVRYADRPPQACARVEEDYECFYEFDGTDFEALVAVGKIATDYDALYHDPSEPLTLHSPYLEAVRRNGYWMVQTPTAQVGTVTPFYIAQGESKDHVLATAVDDDEVIKIARPYKLRRSPFNGMTIRGLRYVYRDDNNRIVTNAEGGREDQIIVPRYWVDDLIWATQTDVQLGDDPEPGVWLDLNVDGRAWAMVFA